MLWQQSGLSSTTNGRQKVCKPQFKRQSAARYGFVIWADRQLGRRENRTSSCVIRSFYSTDHHVHIMGCGRWTYLLHRLHLLLAMALKKKRHDEQILWFGAAVLVGSEKQLTKSTSWCCAPGTSTVEGKSVKWPVAFAGYCLKFKPHQQMVRCDATVRQIPQIVENGVLLRESWSRIKKEG